jgi:hypothetical protein
MKKEYDSPEMKIILITLKDSLAASTYTPTAEVPIRDGDDDPIFDDL